MKKISILGSGMAGCGAAYRLHQAGMASTMYDQYTHFGGHTATGDEMRQAFEGAVGRPLRAATLPWGLMRVMSPLVPMWRELLTMRYLWRRPHRLDDSALVALTGAVQRTPLQQAVDTALADVAALKNPARAVAA